MSEARTRSYVGQVGNLRPSGNRPADQYANAEQAECHSAAGYHPAPHKALTALVNGDEIAGGGADEDLARAGDLLLGVVEHLLPLGQPARRAGNGEQDREDLRV